ncbi:MAG: Flp pilus assembly protein CpaB [Polyangiales bacterium]
MKFSAPTFGAPRASQKAGSAHEPGLESRTALLIATALGVVGALLLMLYLTRFEQEISGGRRVALLTLLKPIGRGELVTADALTVSEVPIAYVEQRAVRESDRAKVVGVRTSHALSPQDTLMWSDLALSTENRDLSSLVAPGKRAITVRASESGADDGNGLVRPGDYVDVLVTLNGEHGASAAVVLLQRVLVLAVGAETQPQAFVDGKDSRMPSARERQLTLSMKVEEAQLLALARARGRLSVALRGPNDSKIIEGVADMPLSSLYDKSARETVQKRREVPSSQGNMPVRVGEGAP